MKYKLVWVGLIAASLFAVPAVDAKNHKTKHSHHARKHGCVRAPDEGSFATAPFRKPPCEPGAGH
ncbi:hypothetical protein M2226_003662 [Bradyrhizobium elkanii]|nr:hypothetical protein [Bradyrhizobium elkanii]MCW2171664.1 hypothetical protein [Bradyrhizobium elkanii]